MGRIFDADSGVKWVADLTKIEPVMFRGVDCAVLAERYAVYRRRSGLDDIEEDSDVVAVTLAPRSENV
ncbi:MAG: hypothetical protein RJA94_2581 [Pseudomonadota bacterium]|jgi:hypothetical protein